MLSKPIVSEHSSINSSKTGFVAFISSLNFFLSIVGYSVVMSIVSPLGIDISEGGNVYFTWPYRIFQILVAGIALFSVRSCPLPKLNWKFRLLGMFWALYLLRAFYDLQVRSVPSPLAWNNKLGIEFQAWCYILPMTLLPMIATLKSFPKIDFQRVLNWILVFGGLGLIASLFSVAMQVDASWSGEIGRANASAMLNTITFGHLGLTVGLCALFKLIHGQIGIFKKVLLVGLGLLGAYIMLRAGSRGPLLACFVVLFIWAMAKSRYAVFGISLAGVFAGGVWIFIDKIIDFISVISPVMASRMLATLETGDSSGRDTLFSEVWNECLKNPLTGFQLDFLGNSHNIILDGFMMFGLIAGWIVLLLVLIGFFSAYKIIKFDKAHMWIGMLLIQQLVAGQTSALFGPDSAVQCLLVVAILFCQELNDRFNRIV